MDYSFAEQVLLALSQAAIELYHVARDRPRTFWGMWAVSFAVAALLLLRPRSSRGELTPSERARVES